MRAQGEIRTPTLLTALAPEASVYTISPPEQFTRELYLICERLFFLGEFDQVGLNN